MSRKSLTAEQRAEPGVATPPAASFVEPVAPEPWRLLAPDGSTAKGYELGLPAEELLSCYRAMLLSRAVDRQAFSLQRQGRLGTFSTVEGQEAAVVGSAWALDPDRDWVVPQYRELPAMLRQGYPLESFFLYFKGYPAGNRIPDGVNLLPFQISLATQLPHAAGLAWGLQAQGSDGAVLAYFGDGASSEGDTHEAMNLAGVRRAPVVFFLQNNGWAISTPLAKQTAGSLVSRAGGYGFPGVLVDGNDLLAIWEATRWAIGRARQGLGPTLIEAMTYRLGPHNTADDPSRYRSDEEVRKRRDLDPLIRVRALIEQSGELEEADFAELEREATARVDSAIDHVENLPLPETGELFDHVHETISARASRQMEKALAGAQST